MNAATGVPRSAAGTSEALDAQLVLDGVPRPPRPARTAYGRRDRGVAPMPPRRPATATGGPTLPIAKRVGLLLARVDASGADPPNRLKPRS